jgi:hypothetical protein
MSETRYPLRNRLARVSAAAPTPGELPLRSAGTANLESGMATLPLTSISGLAMEEKAATVRHEQDSPAHQVASPRLYSDVVATRPSSAASQYDDTQLNAGISETRSAPLTPYIENFTSQVDQAFNESSILLSSTRVMTENPPDEEDNRPWTLVKSRHARRRRSFPTYDTETTGFSRGHSLTSEQEIAVKTAEQKLTSEEQERIDRRYENTKVRNLLGIGRGMHAE